MTKTRDELLVEIKEAVDEAFPGMLEDLRTLVEIPSVSSDPNHAGDVERTAEATKEMFTAAGLDAKVRCVKCSGGVMGAPAVIATLAQQKAAPTVLLYAHHDVQPATAEGWDSPPFEMKIRGDRIYGRGTSDDAAGIIVHLGALKALQKVTGQADLNIVVFIEGEEEIGSPAFGPFLTRHEEALEADVIIVADSSNWTVDTPALTATLRGVVSVDVTVRVARQAVHSGMFGGPTLDAVTAASRMISTLHDDVGNVAVEGVTVNDAANVADVIWEEGDFRRDATTLDGVILLGTGDLAARVWAKPAISVIGFDAPPTGEAVNAIIPKATFRLSMRTVPGQSVEVAAKKLEEHLFEHAPFGAHVEVTVKEMGPSYIADLDSKVVTNYRRALSKAWGTEAVVTGLGASIPFISQFEETFPESTVIVTGVEDPSTNAHGQNESQSIKVLKNATVAEALFLAELAGEGRDD